MGIPNIEAIRDWSKENFAPVGVAQIMSARGEGLHLEGTVEGPMLLNGWVRNLVSYPYMDGSSRSNNGVTFVVNQDGSIVANGTATDDSIYSICVRASFKNAIFLKDGNYYFTGCPAGGSDNSYNIYVACGNPSETKKIFGRDYGSGIKFESVGLEIGNANEYRLQIQLLIKKGYTANNLLFKPMLEEIQVDLDESEYPHSYVPYDGYDVVSQNADGTESSTVHVTNDTTAPVLLKSYDGATNIISPAGAEVSYAVNRQGRNVLQIINRASEGDVIEEIAKGTYEGRNLAEFFGAEISRYSDEWEWIQDRIDKGFYKGLYVCDFIPFDCTNGYHFNVQIAGIDTYRGYGDSEVKNHIDFISKEIWNDLHVMNKVNINNGNANSPSPFLASDLNYWLNSMAGKVPNSTTDLTVMADVDYTNGGVLHYLPDALKTQIITKRILLPSRYTAGQILTADNSWAWQSTGKLWIPSEVEVYGTPVWGNTGYGAGGFVQYPIFKCNMNRMKRRCQNKDRYRWWLLSAFAVASTSFAGVASGGDANHTDATGSGVGAPVCFRIGKTS